MKFLISFLFLFGVLLSSCNQKDKVIEYTYEKGYKDPETAKYPWRAASLFLEAYGKKNNISIHVNKLNDIPEINEKYDILFVDQKQLQEKFNRKKLLNWVKNGGKLIYCNVGLSPQYPDFLRENEFSNLSKLENKAFEEFQKELKGSIFLTYKENFEYADPILLKKLSEVGENSDDLKKTTSPIEILIEKFTNPDKVEKSIDFREQDKLYHMLHDSCRVWEISDKEKNRKIVKIHSESYGRGKVIFLPSVVAFRNRWLGMDDHPNQFITILELPNNSYNQHIQKIGIVLGEPATFLSVIWQRWNFLILLILLFALCWIWKNWSRFGLNKQDQEFFETNTLENSLRLTSIFLWKRNKIQNMIIPIIEDILAKQAQLGISQEEFFEKIQEKSKYSKDEISQIFQQTDLTSSKNIIKTVKILFEIREITRFLISKGK